MEKPGKTVSQSMTKRTKKVEIRVSEDELLSLQKLAQKGHFSTVSGYIREAALNEDSKNLQMALKMREFVKLVHEVGFDG